MDNRGTSPIGGPYRANHITANFRVIARQEEGTAALLSLAASRLRRRILLPLEWSKPIQRHDVRVGEVQAKSPMRERQDRTAR